MNISIQATRMIKLTIPFFLLFLPSLGISSDGSEVVAPLEQLIALLAGPVGISLMGLTVVASGFMFLSGRWDVMRLAAATVGCGLVFGGVQLADYLMMSS